MSRISSWKKSSWTSAMKVMPKKTVTLTNKAHKYTKTENKWARRIEGGSKRLVGGFK